jgi:hypothetical protein
MRYIKQSVLINMLIIDLGTPNNSRQQKIDQRERMDGVYLPSPGLAHKKVSLISR